MSGMPVARVGDTCSHGAVIITGADTQSTDSRQLARMGDLVMCPIHGVNPIVSVVAKTSADNMKPFATIGAMSACGAVIVTASPNMAAGA